jgi:DNA-binding transcriptional LysR family regulator
MISWKPWFLRARLKTRHLLLISAIGEEGNINRAAEILNMSQPAASRLLRDLEEIVGTDLFERLPRGVRPNWYGEAMIRHARNALTSLGEAVLEIDALKAGRTGQVNVGTIAGPAISIVPRAVTRLTKEYPLVKIQLLVDTSDRLLEALRTGGIEIMVGRLLDRNDNSDCSFQCLTDEPVCGMVRKGHPLLGRPSLDYKDVAQCPWIVPPAGTILRHQFNQMFRDAGLDIPSQLIETVSPMLITRLLEDTEFIAVLARDVAEYYAACGLVSILPIKLSCNMESYGIITRKGMLLSPAALMMYDALEDCASPGKANGSYEESKKKEVQASVVCRPSAREGDGYSGIAGF